MQRLRVAIEQSQQAAKRVRFGDIARLKMLQLGRTAGSVKPHRGMQTRLNGGFGPIVQRPPANTKGCVPDFRCWCEDQDTG